MSTTSKNQEIIVTSGSTDDGLADAFIYAFDPRHPDFRVEFNGHWASDTHMMTTLPISAQITGLVYESGTRGMLLIQANLQIGSGRSWQAIGFYNAKNRSGYFKPGHFGWNEVESA